MKRILGVLTTICALVGCQPNRAMYQSVDVATFAEIIQDSNVVLLDVRTQSEYEAGHIPNAILKAIITGNQVDRPLFFSIKTFLDFNRLIQYVQ